MKKLDYLFSKANLCWVFLTVCACCFATFCVGWYFLKDLSITPNHFTWPLFLIISAIFGLMMTGMTFVLRTTNRFYRAVDVLEEKAKAATTIPELQDLFEKEFKPLQKDAGFRVQGDRLRQVYYYMEGKYNAFRNQEANPGKTN